MKVSRVLWMYREVSYTKAWQRFMEARAKGDSNLAKLKLEKIKDGIRQLDIQEGRVPEDELLEMKLRKRRYFQRFDIVPKELLEVLPDAAMFEGSMWRPPGPRYAKKKLTRVLKRPLTFSKGFHQIRRTPFPAYMRTVLNGVKTEQDLADAVRLWKRARDCSVEVGIYSTELVRAAIRVNHRRFASLLMHAGAQVGFFRRSEHYAIMAADDVRRGRRTARQWFIKMLESRTDISQRAITSFVKTFVHLEDDDMIFAVLKQFSRKKKNDLYMVPEGPIRKYIGMLREKGERQKAVAAETFIGRNRGPTSFTWLRKPDLEKA